LTYTLGENMEYSMTNIPRTAILIATHVTMTLVGPGCASDMASESHSPGYDGSESPVEADAEFGTAKETLKRNINSTGVIEVTFEKDRAYKLWMVASVQDFSKCNFRLSLVKNGAVDNWINWFPATISCGLNDCVKKWNGKGPQYYLANVFEIVDRNERKGTYKVYARITNCYKQDTWAPDDFLYWYKFGADRL
jgi:hypothetical protein